MPEPQDLKSPDAMNSLEVAGKLTYDELRAKYLSVHGRMMMAMREYEGARYLNEALGGGITPPLRFKMPKAKRVQNYNPRVWREKVLSERNG